MQAAYARALQAARPKAGKALLALLVPALVVGVFTVVESSDGTRDSRSGPEGREGRPAASPGASNVGDEPLPGKVALAQVSARQVPASDASSVKTTFAGSAADQGDSVEAAYFLSRAALEAELESLRTELEIRNANQGTPLESLHLTPDAESLSTADLEQLETLLDYLPIHFHTGEPTWIAEHALDAPGAGVRHLDDDAVLRFLGRERVLGQLSLRQLATAWDTIGGDFPLALGMTRDEAVELRERLAAAELEPRMWYSFGDEDL